MSLIRSSRVRITLILALALVLGASSYAFAAANTVPASGAGDGQGAISGYVASAIHYNLNTGDPSAIDSVSFTLTPEAGAGAPTTVKAQLGTIWSTGCTLSSTTWTCAFSGATVQPADSLRIVAAQ